MPYATTDDGVRLYYEEAGAGTPVVFVHEFAGDMGSWEPQLRHFAHRYRALAYNARGYPPSEAPEDPARYGQARAADDIAAVMDAAGIDRAHVCGLSMGGFATLHFGFRHAARARSLVVAGCGYGAEPDKRAQFRAEAEATAALIERDGMAAFADIYSRGPTRVQFENKDPRGWREFRDRLAEHSQAGAAATMRGVQALRPSLYDLTDEMAALRVPTLVLTGDEDWPCLLPGVLMKQTIPSAALSVMVNCGHTINIEEPDEFNRICGAFFAQVDAGRWPEHDPRAVTASILGVEAKLGKMRSLRVDFFLFTDRSFYFRSDSRYAGALRDGASRRGPADRSSAPPQDEAGKSKTNTTLHPEEAIEEQCAALRLEMAVSKDD